MAAILFVALTGYACCKGFAELTTLAERGATTGAGIDYFLRCEETLFVVTYDVFLLEILSYEFALFELTLMACYYNTSLVSVSDSSLASELVSFSDVIE